MNFRIYCLKENLNRYFFTENFSIRYLSLKQRLKITVVFGVNPKNGAKMDKHSENPWKDTTNTIGLIMCPLEIMGLTRSSAKV